MSDERNKTENSLSLTYKLYTIHGSFTCNAGELPRLEKKIDTADGHSGGDKCHVSKITLRSILV